MSDEPVGQIHPIKKARVAVGLSISKASALSGVAKSYIATLERDWTTANPSIGVLRSLSLVYGMTVDSIWPEQFPYDDGDLNVIEMRKFTDLQEWAGRWGDKVFPESSLMRMLKHLSEEVSELHVAVVRDLFDRKEELRCTEEIADVMLLLMRVADAMDVSAYVAAVEKLRINEKRKWDKATGRHIE